MLPHGKNEKGKGAKKKSKESPAKKDADDKDKKRRSSLGDSPVTSSSSSTASAGDSADDGEARNISAPGFSSTAKMPSYQNAWLRRFHQDVLAGNSTAFQSRVQMICTTLMRKNNGCFHDMYRENELIPYVMQGIVSQYYDPAEQTTILMSLVSTRDLTKPCSKSDHGYCRIAGTLMKNLKPEDLHNLLRVCTKRQQKTALHFAVEIGELCQMRVLLDQDIDPNAVDASGRTPLHRAIERNNVEAVKMLMWYGADISQSPRGQQSYLPRILAMNVDTNRAENALSGWYQTRMNALERKYSEWLRTLCGHVYHVLDNASELHLIRLSRDSEHKLISSHPCVQRSNTLRLTKNLNYTLYQPHEVALLFMVPVFFQALDEASRADTPQVCRFALSSLNSHDVLLPHKPILVGPNTEEELSSAIHPTQNGHFYAYTLPPKLAEGLYTVNFNVNLAMLGDQSKHVFLAMQTVSCREIDKNKTKID
jgi:hypothetical protein